MTSTPKRKFMQPLPTPSDGRYDVSSSDFGKTIGSRVMTRGSGYALGRFLLGAIFVASGVEKIMNAGETEQYIQSKKLPRPDVLRMAAVGVELGIAPLFALGVLPRYSAPLLASFLVPTTLLFHDFWNEEEEMGKKSQTINFMKNLAIIGGLVSIAFYDYEAKAKSGESAKLAMEKGYSEDLIGELRAS
jgi:putative oxidoreductase